MPQSCHCCCLPASFILTILPMEVPKGVQQWECPAGLEGGCVMGPLVQFREHSCSVSNQRGCIHRRYLDRTCWTARVFNPALHCGSGKDHVASGLGGSTFLLHLAVFCVFPLMLPSFNPSSPIVQIFNITATSRPSTPARNRVLSIGCVFCHDEPCYALTL